MTWKCALLRLPSHYADKRADLHAEVDALLTDWQAAGA